MSQLHCRHTALIDEAADRSNKSAILVSIVDV